MIYQRVQLSILITIDPGMKPAYEQYFVKRHKCTLVGRGKGRYELYFPHGTRRQKSMLHQYRYLLPDGEIIRVETPEGQQESFVTLPLASLDEVLLEEGDRNRVSIRKKIMHTRKLLKRRMVH